jgi:hypothetical protein
MGTPPTAPSDPYGEWSGQKSSSPTDIHPRAAAARRTTSAGWVVEPLWRSAGSRPHVRPHFGDPWSHLIRMPLTVTDPSSSFRVSPRRLRFTDPSTPSGWRPGHGL